MPRQQEIPRVQCEFIRTCSAGAERTHVPRVKAEFVRASSARQEHTPQQRNSKADQDLLQRACRNKVEAQKAQVQAYYDSERMRRRSVLHEHTVPTQHRNSITDQDLLKFAFRHTVDLQKSTGKILLRCAMHWEHSASNSITLQNNGDTTG